MLKNGFLPPNDAHLSFSKGETSKTINTQSIEYQQTETKQINNKLTQIRTISLQ
jgi:hypothetical protein